MTTSTFGFDLVMLKLGPAPVCKLVREESQKKTLCNWTSKCFVEIGLWQGVSVASLITVGFS